MNVFFAHLPITPFLYAVCLAIAFFILRWRWNRGDYGHIALSLALLWALFSMHGEQAETRMGAALAVLIIDIFLALKTLSNQAFDRRSGHL